MMVRKIEKGGMVFFILYSREKMAFHLLFFIFVDMKKGWRHRWCPSL